MQNGASLGKNQARDRSWNQGTGPEFSGYNAKRYVYVALVVHHG